MAVGIPVKEDVVKAPKDFSLFRSPGGRALVVSFYGASTVFIRPIQP